MDSSCSDFKIIAVRPLEGCDENISKCLQKDQIYYLCNDYIINEKDSIDYTQSNLRPISKFFFSLNNKKEKRENNQREHPIISISAIVGRNGDGKSSLIELIMRLINNFAQYNKLNPNYGLLKVKGVRASLHYRLNDEFFKLKEDNNGPTLYRIGRLIHKNTKDEICEIEAID